MRIFCFGILACASLAFGQLDTHTVSITASRYSVLPPDQALFSLTVNTGVGASLDDVVNAIQGSGVTAANLSSVFTQQVLLQNGPQSTQQWTFTLNVPFAQMKDTFTSLAKLQQTIAQQNKGISLTYTLQGTQTSPQLVAAQQCSMPDLLADAQGQAQKLADAAGFFLGPVLSVSSGAATAVPTLVRGFLPVTAFISQLPVQVPQNCSIQVHFRLN